MRCVNRSVCFVAMLGTNLAYSGAGPALAFDMPHGGCRLFIDSDGSATLAYAAMPGFVHVRPGTFDVRKVRKAFRSKVTPASRMESLSRPIGSVFFHRNGGEVKWWFNDAHLATGLLKRAWAKRLPAATDGDEEHALFPAKACRLD